MEVFSSPAGFRIYTYIAARQYLLLRSSSAYSDTSQNIDLIFAQSDYIALDVYKICQQVGVEKINT